MTEAQLVQRCRQGDREAQRELYARTSERIYRLLLRMTGDTEDAFDLSQETYLRAFANMGEFQGGSGVATWIYRIAVNEALQHLRRKKRQVQKLRLVPSGEMADDSQAASIASMDVREALAAMPDEERTLIILRHFDGLSYDEMAAVLDKPSGTIASALNRARRLLRERLEEKPRIALKSRLPGGI